MWDFEQLQPMLGKCIIWHMSYDFTMLKYTRRLGNSELLCNSSTCTTEAGQLKISARLVYPVSKRRAEHSISPLRI